MFDSDVIKKGINDQAVLQAMRDVDRRKFVSDKLSLISLLSIELAELETKLYTAYIEITVINN